MTPEATLERIAQGIALRLAGPDARRRLEIALAYHPETAGKVMATTRYRLERIEAMLSGAIRPECLQDRLDLHNAIAERSRPPFRPDYWIIAEADLCRAGFAPDQARSIIAELRSRIAPMTPISIAEPAHA